MESTADHNVVSERVSILGPAPAKPSTPKPTMGSSAEGDFPTIASEAESVMQIDADADAESESEAQDPIEGTPEVYLATSGLPQRPKSASRAEGADAYSAERNATADTGVEMEMQSGKRQVETREESCAEDTTTSSSLLPQVPVDDKTASLTDKKTIDADVAAISTLSSSSSAPINTAAIPSSNVQSNSKIISNPVANVNLDAATNSQSDQIINSNPTKSDQPDCPLNPLLEATLTAHTRGISRLVFSNDGRYLASAGGEGVVHIWDAHTYSHLRALRGHTRGINDIAFSADSRYIASASDDNTAIIWSVTKGIPLRTLTSHTSHVLCLAFNAKGNLLATAGWDETVILWDIRRGSVVRTLPAHSDPITSVAFNPDGSMLLTASYDGLMRLWDASTGQCLKTIEDEQNAPISFAAFTPNGDYLVSASLSSTIRIWNYHTSKVLKTYQGHVNVKYSVGVVIYELKGHARRQQSSKQECQKRDQTTNGHQDHVAMEVQQKEESRKPAAKNQGGYIISGSDTNEVCIWDLQSRKILRKFQAHSDTVIAIAAHPFRDLIATGGTGTDKTVKLWTL